MSKLVEIVDPVNTEPSNLSLKGYEYRTCASFSGSFIYIFILD